MLGSLAAVFSLNAKVAWRYLPGQGCNWVVPVCLPASRDSAFRASLVQPPLLGTLCAFSVATAPWARPVQAHLWSAPAGVPTTRALSLVATGADVPRDQFYKSGFKVLPCASAESLRDSAAGHAADCAGVVGRPREGAVYGEQVSLLPENFGITGHGVLLCLPIIRRHPAGCPCNTSVPLCCSAPGVSSKHQHHDLAGATW